ncbi:diguanylate cyclase [Thauera sp.]|uniref:diguanylate cyclase n=1 Tax=Thauera sp. TaxID=1905334 RepID=UPI002A36809D|nr:diguanylate cyclase [Thauera sp.]MDX9886349.1 diguanylate cyclase [Thauera sp.]
MNAAIKDDLAEALANCAREPVHAPEAIQPAGCLVCVDNGLQRVLQVSANISEILGVAPEQAFDLSPDGLLGHRMLEELRNLRDEAGNLPLTLEAQAPRVSTPSGRLQATVYRSDCRWVFEIEPIVPSSGQSPLELLNRWVRVLSLAQSRDQLFSRLVEAVERLAGYDRIMVYQFDEQWHGTVVSEARRDPMESFLGHRFPATDIPPQVRALYGTNPVRSIPDAQAPAVSLISHEDRGYGRVDMGPGYLRASSPVHLRYLANMGVGASLSVAIHGEEGLWGLLACHHGTPKALSPDIRDTVLALVQMASQRLFLLETRGQMRYVKSVFDSRQLVSPSQGHLLTTDELMREHGQHWQSLFDACGLALLSRLGVSRLGITPQETVLAHIANCLNAAHHENGPWFSDQLSATPLVEAGELSGCAGLLALPLNVESPPVWFLVFRQEQVSINRWAGRPEDVLAEENGHTVLTPRHSFATWVEEVRGKSRPWLPIEVQAAQDLAEDLAVAVSINHIAHLNGELQDVNRRLQSLAHTDSLTGVSNRYHLEKSIDVEIKAAQRYQRPCSLLLFDIDHFKQFNDQHGHEAGDQVLKKLAATVAACLRAPDRFGRWGGEEFVILTGIEAEGAVLLAERIRRQVAALDVGELGRVTVSIGVAEYRSGDGREQLVARADQAMYQAKKDGRNRVASVL